MEFIQTKPLYNQSYNDCYDHGFYNSNNHVARRGIDIGNNMYKEKDDFIKPFKTNMKKSCNNYFARQTPPLDIDDIIDGNSSCNEKLDFDFEEHILPPCFDTLINAENQMLAPPDLNILKLASSDIDNEITTEDANEDRINNNEDTLKRQQRNDQRIELCPTISPFDHEDEEDMISRSTPDKLDSPIVPIALEKVQSDNGLTSTAMSEKEIELIKEVNKTLDCILPVKKEDDEVEDNAMLDSELDFDNDIFEPLQQVPCLEDINLSTRPNKDYHENQSDEYDRSLNDDYQKDLTNCYNNNLCNNTYSNNSCNNYNNNLCNNYDNNLCNSYSTEVCTDHTRDLCNEYNRELCSDYSRDLCNEYPKELYIKTEPNSLQNGFFIEPDDGSSFYDLIEEQVRHQKQKRENEARISRKILDRYLPEEQELIKRYIEGDRAHLPIPPVNIEIQEIIKRERKKHKNRVAASKCRKKKLEREAQLEVRVNYLKERSIELNTVVRDLRNQATTLKQRIMEHINAGCTLNPNVLPNGINPYYG